MLPPHLNLVLEIEFAEAADTAQHNVTVARAFTNGAFVTFKDDDDPLRKVMTWSTRP